MKKQEKTPQHLINHVENLQESISKHPYLKTKHDKTIEELNIERLQLLSIFDSIDEYVYISDPNTYEIIYANKALKQHFGNVTGKKCYRALQNLVSPCPFCTNDKIFGPNLGKTYIWEAKNKKDNRYYRCIDKAIKWPDGRMVRYEMAIDLTIRKMTEEALLEAEEKYRHIVENSIDGVLMIQNGKIVYVNNALCKIFGYNTSQLIGKHVLKLVHPKDYILVSNRMKNRFKGKKVVSHYEIRGIKKGGSTIIIETASSGPFTYDKRPTILSIIRDVTTRKQLEKRLSILNDCFIHFTNNPIDNINSLVAVCGEIMEAKCALYNRLEDNLLCSIGKWHVPKDFKTIDKPKGHICYDVIKENKPRLKAIRHLENTAYYKSDPNVKKYNLKTYIGHTVKFKDNYVGSLCVLYKKDFIPKNEDKWLMGVIASAIAVEEDRRFTLHKLSESEKKYREFTNSLPQTTFEIDMQGNLLFVNDIAYEIFGYTKKDFQKGLNCLQMLIPGDRNRAIKEIQSPEPGIGTEYTGLKKDGTTFPILIYSRAIIADGKPVGARGVIIDITEQQRIKEALQKTDERFRQIAENSQEWIWEVDTKGLYTYSNPVIEKILGYKPQETVCKKHFYSFFDPKDIKYMKTEAFKIFKKKKSFRRFINKNIHKDGRTVWLSTSGVPILDEKGNLLGYRGSDTDITKSVSAQHELDRLNKELLSKNRKLKQLALKDILTGLYNHNYLEEIIDIELDRTRRYAHPLSAIMIDIDYFKSINSVYGHQFGDIVLKQLAKQLKEKLRRYDIIIRYSGEEFLVISPGTDRERSINISRRLLDALSLQKFGNNKHKVKLKLSIGIASYPQDKVFKGMDLVDLADRILSKAKEDGGNRVYSCLDTQKRINKKSKISDAAQDTKYLKNKVSKLTKQANQNLIEAIFAFAKTIELKDHYTGEHVERTVQYATEIAHALNVSKSEIELIRQAAILHDLGKIGISETILLKNSKLTKKEFEEIKKHPQIAADILRPIHFLKDIIPYIFYHHERWDGKGYPSGLKGNEIPFGARIISIADAYQALISDRPYRKAYSNEEVIKMIKSDSGLKFDPNIVNVFLNILK